MKKGEIYTGKVVSQEFPNKCKIAVDGEELLIHSKGGLVGQTVNVRVTKKRSDKGEGNILEIIEKAEGEIEPACPHFSICGGCAYQNLSYDDQKKMKCELLRGVLEDTVNKEIAKNPRLGIDADDYFDSIFEGLVGSPISEEYRNKMEFSFGDGCKGGELELGLHKKGSFYDIVSVKDCQIVDSDYRAILSETLSYFRGKECTYYHKLSHEGFLRHLVIRKAVKTGEILVNLVTSSQIPADTPCTEVSIIEDWKEAVLALDFKGKIAGIIHTINDSLSDVVQADKINILYGQDYFYEELLGLKFRISPFSFFQTNSLGAEVLYSKAREYIFDGALEEGVESDKIVYDLYSGTGTIAQLIAPVAKKVIGVEIIEEAVVAARDNAKLNGLKNCEFIAGDVLKALDDITEKPDFIILDPPRDGVHPKALRKIIDYGVDNLIYISCKPTSLARDLETLIGCGYVPVKICGVDQFPQTNHCEVITSLVRK